MEMKENDKMITKSVILLLKHAETGNSTGEVAAVRKELEDYLIDKDYEKPRSEHKRVRFRGFVFF